ncbi:MAG TPA: SoxR reducing system RseC family protein [Halanaerobiaceae bacterium]|nr:SoxR reducing system RseC family protein [Halanaerobiaceae bacterium]
MEEIGVVLENKGQEALVKIKRHSLCSNCKNKCQLAMGNSHESKEMEISVKNPLGASKGDQVKIEMGEESLVTASLIIYLIPLFGLIAGYFAGINLFPGKGEITGIIGALIVMALSFFLVNRIDKFLGRKNKYQPVIKAIIKNKGSN